MYGSESWSFFSGGYPMFVLFGTFVCHLGEVGNVFQSSDVMTFFKI